MYQGVSYEGNHARGNSTHSEKQFKEFYLYDKFDKIEA
jgi:hypothetical protein